MYPSPQWASNAATVDGEKASRAADMATCNDDDRKNMMTMMMLLLLLVYMFYSISKDIYANDIKCVHLQAHNGGFGTISVPNHFAHLNR